MAVKSTSGVSQCVETTNGGNGPGGVNVSARPQIGETMDLVSSGTPRAMIPYILNQAQFDAYVPVEGAPHPVRPQLTLVAAPAREITGEDGVKGCWRVEEIYEQTAPFDLEFPPPNDYSMRSSEFSSPIPFNDNFWEIRPGPSVLENGKWVCSTLQPGELKDWAKGFKGDGAGKKPLPVGMEPAGEGEKINAFPSCHPAFAIDGYLTSGAEWVCTDYHASQPLEADMGELHVIENPVGLADATFGLWLYVGISSDKDAQWWTQTRVWRFKKNGWEPNVYPPPPP